MKIVQSTEKAKLPPLPDPVPPPVARQIVIFATMVFKGDTDLRASSVRMISDTALKNVRKLAAFFDQPLLTKEGDELHVTPFGQSLFEEARPSVELIERILERAAERSKKPGGLPSIRKLIGGQD